MEIKTSPDYASVFAVLSQLIEVGFVVVNKAGDIDFVSERAADLLGHEDRNGLSACHPDAEEAIRSLLHAIRTDGAQSIQKEIRINDGGEIRRLSLDIRPLEEDDCTGYLLVVKDSESMRRMATDLRMAAQFRNARRLYHAVVEDLKQPISAVMLHGDLLRDALVRDDAEGAEPSREARSLDVIRRQIGELNRTLTLLLEEIDPADTEEQGFSLVEVIEDVVRLIEPEAAMRNVYLGIESNGAVARMNGSRQRVKQALLHLAVNALDAVSAGGRIEIDVSVQDGDAVVHVRDDGPGIAKHLVPKIFDLHFTTKNNGTGVGLHVARDVIQRHGGHIEVEESREGHGTTFVVTLPVGQSVT